MEELNDTVNYEETPVNGQADADVTDSDQGDGDDGSTPLEGEREIFTDEASKEESIDEDEELSELRRISGVEYESVSDFSGYARYRELKKSGVLTAEEAFYAVNRGKSTSFPAQVKSTAEGTKHHMTASSRKPSSGEVFTRADREELAKWGISATGFELERLWREAGRN